MYRILLIHPWFRVLGGAELVALHLLRWCTERAGAHVTLLTLYPVDQENLQNVSGIRWDTDRVEILIAPSPLILRSTDSLSILRLAFLHRRARSIAARYTLCISSYGEADFGVRGAQIIHHPMFAPRKILRRYNMIRETTVLDRSDFLAEIYRGICFLVSGNRVSGFRRNLTLPNTAFLQSVVEEVYGIRGEIFPPAILPERRSADRPPWEARESLIVALGRFAPDKGYLRLMDLFAALAGRHAGLHFAVIGRVQDAGYAVEVRRRGDELRLPIEFVTDASNEEVEAYLSRARFLLHAKEFEHFGISLLEAADHGCIPLAHDSGGVPEILRSPILRYRSADELLEHFERLNRDAEVRAEIETELAGTLDRFRVRSFDSALERLLGPFFARGRESR